MAGRLDNYITVADRLEEATPDIQSVESMPIHMLTDYRGYMQVKVTLKDGRWSVGTASFDLALADKGVRSAQATNPIEDCETSALGRALVLLGYALKRKDGVASIASRDEIIEAEYRAEAYTNRAARKSPPTTMRNRKS